MNPFSNGDERGTIFAFGIASDLRSNGRVFHKRSDTGGKGGVKTMGGGCYTRVAVFVAIS